MVATDVARVIRRGGWGDECGSFPIRNSSAVEFRARIEIDPMSFAIKLRKGDGPFWGTLKRAARSVLQFHLPVSRWNKPIFGLLYRSHVFARESIAWALRFFWYEPLFRSQCATVGDAFRMEQLPYITGRGRIVIGHAVRLSGKPSLGFSNRLEDPPELVIGDGTFIGHGCSINVAESVRIGKHCLIAGGVRISDFDGHPVDARRRRDHEPTPADAVKRVVIGDDAWLGAGSVILKGVTVGERSIVGTGSVVTRDVPPDVIVAGCPARIVRRLAVPRDDSAKPECHATALHVPEDDGAGRPGPGRPVGG
jgi:acetyltransferase-like isoleucine patch superfamily enzyme